MTKYYALMEGPSHAVIVGPFDDYEQAGDWGIDNETGDWTYRGSLARLSLTQWAKQHGRDRR